MPGKPSSSSPIPSSPDARRGLPRPRRATSPRPHFPPVQPSYTSDASVLLPRMRRSLRAVACCRIWGEGEPRRRRGRGSPSPQAPHPFPCALLSGRMKYDATRKPPFAHLSPDDTKEKLFRLRSSSRNPADEKENPSRQVKNVHAGENHHAGNETPRRSTRRPGDTPPPQRAGARRRSPQRGSAAAGAHIAREAGRCAPTAPCGERRTRYTTGDSDARRHTGQGGVRGSQGV